MFLPTRGIVQPSGRPPVNVSALQSVASEMSFVRPGPSSIASGGGSIRNSNNHRNNRTLSPIRRLPSITTITSNGKQQQQQYTTSRTTFSSGSGTSIPPASLGDLMKAYVTHCLTRADDIREARRALCFNDVYFKIEDATQIAASTSGVPLDAEVKPIHDEQVTRILLSIALQEEYRVAKEERLFAQLADDPLLSLPLHTAHIDPKSIADARDQANEQFQRAILTIAQQIIASAPSNYKNDPNNRSLSPTHTTTTTVNVPPDPVAYYPVSKKLSLLQNALPKLDGFISPLTMMRQHIEASRQSLGSFVMKAKARTPPGKELDNLLLDIRADRGIARSMLRLSASIEKSLLQKSLEAAEKSMQEANNSSNISNDHSSPNDNGTVASMNTSNHRPLIAPFEPMVAQQLSHVIDPRTMPDPTNGILSPSAILGPSSIVSSQGSQHSSIYGSGKDSRTSKIIRPKPIKTTNNPSQSTEISRSSRYSTVSRNTRKSNPRGGFKDSHTVSQYGDSIIDNSTLYESEYDGSMNSNGQERYNRVPAWKIAAEASVIAAYGGGTGKAFPRRKRTSRSPSPSRRKNSPKKQTSEVPQDPNILYPNGPMNNLSDQPPNMYNNNMNNNYNAAYPYQLQQQQQSYYRQLPQQQQQLPYPLPPHMQPNGNYFQNNANNNNNMMMMGNNNSNDFQQINTMNALQQQYQYQLQQRLQQQTQQYQPKDRSIIISAGSDRASTAGTHFSSSIATDGFGQALSGTLPPWATSPSPLLSGGADPSSPGGSPNAVKRFGSLGQIKVTGLTGTIEPNKSMDTGRISSSSSANFSVGNRYGMGASNFSTVNMNVNVLAPPDSRGNIFPSSPSVRVSSSSANPLGGMGTPLSTDSLISGTISKAIAEARARVANIPLTSPLLPPSSASSGSLFTSTGTMNNNNYPSSLITPSPMNGSANGLFPSSSHNIAVTPRTSEAVRSLGGMDDNCNGSNGTLNESAISQNISMAFTATAVSTGSASTRAATAGGGIGTRVSTAGHAAAVSSLGLDPQILLQNALNAALRAQTERATSASSFGQTVPNHGMNNLLTTNHSGTIPMDLNSPLNDINTGTTHHHLQQEGEDSNSVTPATTSRTTSRAQSVGTYGGINPNNGPLIRVRTSDGMFRGNSRAASRLDGAVVREEDENEDGRTSPLPLQPLNTTDDTDTTMNLVPVELELSPEDMQRRQAARHIQSVYRGHHTRARMETTKESIRLQKVQRKAAARKLQKNLRRNAKRKAKAMKLANKPPRSPDEISSIDPNDAQQQEAARTLQSAFVYRQSLNRRLRAKEAETLNTRRTMKQKYNHILQIDALSANAFSSIATYGPEFETMVVTSKEEEINQINLAQNREDKARQQGIELSHRAKLPHGWVAIYDDTGDNITGYLNTATGQNSREHPGMKAALKDAEKKAIQVRNAEENRVATWKEAQTDQIRQYSILMQDNCNELWAVRVRHADNNHNGNGNNDEPEDNIEELMNAAVDYADEILTLLKEG